MGKANNKLGQQHREFQKNTVSNLQKLQTDVNAKVAVQDFQQLQSEVDDKATVQDVKQFQTEVIHHFEQLQAEVEMKANIAHVPTLQSFQQLQSEINDKATGQSIQQLQAEVARKANVEQVPTLQSFQQFQSEANNKATAQVKRMMCMQVVIVFLFFMNVVSVYMLWSTTSQRQAEMSKKPSADQVPTLKDFEQLQMEVAKITSADRVPTPEDRQLQKEAKVAQKASADQVPSLLADFNDLEQFQMKVVKKARTDQVSAPEAFKRLQKAIDDQAPRGIINITRLKLIPRLAVVVKNGNGTLTLTQLTSAKVRIIITDTDRLVIRSARQSNEEEESKGGMGSHGVCQVVVRKLPSLLVSHETMYSQPWSGRRAG